MNITLWFKLLGTDTLGGVPPAQKILFDKPNKGIELYEWPDWQTNIKSTQNSNRTGVRSANMEDAGFDGTLVVLKGHINEAAPTQDKDNLFDFLKRLQITDDLPGGIFCIDNPNGPKMSIEAQKAGVGGATKTHGLSIMRGSSIRWNPTNKSYDFNFRMIHGGDLS